MNESIIGVFIPIVAIVMSLTIPIVAIITDYRRRRDLINALHRERLAAIERGMEPKPLPEELLSPSKRLQKPRYLLNGLIWLFVGIGTCAFLGSLVGLELAWVGLIPAGVGLAFLIYYWVEGRHEEAADRERAKAAAASPVRE